MIKVNQVTTQKEIDLLSRADVLGFALGHEGFGLDDLARLRRGGRKSALSAAAGGGWALGDFMAALDDVPCDYLEFTPAEPQNAATLAEELEILARVDRPKIANGFFVLSDDDSFLRMADYFETLRQHGVVLFQVEIDSRVDPARMLPPKLSARLDALLAAFPCLVSDDFRGLSGYPRSSATGFFLTLRRGDGANYDLSDRAFALSKVVTLLRDGDGRAAESPEISS
ncbi:MAG: hypothetical protein K0S37_2841 [Microbacterium sp.]|jgi:hypothetical protein|nr:hypothetical protein [Microbacterium sp.]